MGSILGRPLRTRIVSPTLWGWLRDDWRRPGHDLAPHPYAIELVELEVAPDPLAGPPVDAPLHGLVLPLTRAENTLEWHRGSCGVRIQAVRNRATIAAWGVGEASGPELWAALQLAFTEVLRASGLLPIHAAVVVRGGRAMAIAGRSGAGKSTTLLRALRSGWGVLAEDLSWLDPESLTLYGWDRGLRLWPETIERFAPELADLPSEQDARGKRFFSWEALGGPMERTATLERVLLLERDGAEHALTPAEVVRVVWEATGVPALPSAREVVAEAVPSLVGRIAFGRHALGAPLPR